MAIIAAINYTSFRYILANVYCRFYDRYGGRKPETGKTASMYYCLSGRQSLLNYKHIL